MKKLLATIIATGAIAATVLGASASENVVYEETFNNETTTLWGWSTENNSVKKYTGYAEFMRRRYQKQTAYQTRIFSQIQLPITTEQTPQLT